MLNHFRNKRGGADDQDVDSDARSDTGNKRRRPRKPKKEEAMRSFCFATNTLLAFVRQTLLLQS